MTNLPHLLGACKNGYDGGYNQGENALSERSGTKDIEYSGHYAD